MRARIRHHAYARAPPRHLGSRPIVVGLVSAEEDLTSRVASRLVFFLNDPATPEISPLSLHDALPIGGRAVGHGHVHLAVGEEPVELLLLILFRSEERFSRNAETDLVWRLLLEKT